MCLPALDDRNRPELFLACEGSNLSAVSGEKGRNADGEILSSMRIRCAIPHPFAARLQFDRHPFSDLLLARRLNGIRDIEVPRIP